MGKKAFFSSGCVDIVKRKFFGRKLCQIKYGSSNIWCTSSVSFPHACDLWKNIRSLWEEYEKLIQLKLEDDKITLFRCDDWVGNPPLKRQVPHLFSFAENSRATIN